MRAGDAEINALDHHVAFFLRIDQRLVHAFLGGIEIDDLALAHAARRRLADAQNFDRAIGPFRRRRRRYFRCADLEAYH